jgi:uncharacterized protein YqfB (UPF0267 family)
MKIISFAWTTRALLAGAKTCTRRDWTERHAATFHAGDIVQAYNKSQRSGGRRVALIRLTADPSLEPLAEMPDSDYEAEGFRWLFEQDEALAARINGRLRDDFISQRCSPEGFEAWRRSEDFMWVVRFVLESVEVTAG